MSRDERSDLYEHIFHSIPMGLFLVDQNRAIYAWNMWMVAYTKITAEHAIGRTLQALYTESISPRFETALEDVLQHGYPQILSGVLNQFIIPIPLNKHAYSELSMMQQNVEILSVHHHDQNMALVVIQDISDKVHLKNTLISMAAKFEKSSLIDALTNMYNRRFLWKYLKNTLQSAQREGYSVICGVFDLDYFKKINDMLGHHAGDEVLISFSHLARSQLRAGDYLFRYGGDEFVVICVRISIKQAVVSAERLRKKLEIIASHGSVKIKVTCSAGFACWQPTDPPLSAEKLVEQADRAL